MGRKSKYRNDISEIVSQYPNGVKADNIINKMLCSRPTVYYNLSKLIENGEVYEKNNKYFLKHNKNEKHIDSLQHILNLKNYKFLIIDKIIETILRNKGIDISLTEIPDKFIKPFNDGYSDLVFLDILLQDSIKISYQGEKPFHITNTLQKEFIAKIKELINKFILSPEIFLNINSFSELNFTFTISFGKDLDKRVSEYKHFNFSRLKEKLSEDLFGIDESKLYVLKNIAKLQNNERDEKISLIKEQLSIIENEVDSYDFLNDENKEARKDLLKYQYKTLLGNYTFLEKDNIEEVKKHLQIITQKYLKGMKAEKKIFKSDKDSEKRREKLNKLYQKNTLNIKSYLKKYSF